MNSQNEIANVEGIALTAGLGVAVIVRGVVVAWFAELDEAAEDWCRENYFGEWLTWRAKQPEIVPLTPEETADIERRAEELRAHFHEVPNAEFSGPRPHRS
jgi:hypothetical protein